jgi:ABC-type ATPase with predicted acetyltransferase domain
MDLLRPETRQEAKDKVACYANDEPEILQRDFYQSLLAAFTLEEIHRQLHQACLDFTVTQSSDRHVFITGRIP